MNGESHMFSTHGTQKSVSLWCRVPHGCLLAVVSLPLDGPRPVTLRPVPTLWQQKKNDRSCFLQMFPVYLRASGHLWWTSLRRQRYWQPVRLPLTSKHRTLSSECLGVERCRIYKPLRLRLQTLTDQRFETLWDYPSMLFSVCLPGITRIWLGTQT